MRQRFEAQLTIGSTPIESIQIPTKSRDEFPQFLRAMQYIYMNTDINEQIFSLLEKTICPKHNTGRPGMDLWTIFVLAGSRLCLNTDYDRLHYLSNNDSLLRQMLGVHDGIIRGREFDRQTIIDNVQLLDDETLKEINDITVKLGHQTVKKKETDPLRIKIDSFVTKSNVHFPTDYNLLWDSGRKGLDMVKKLIETDLSYFKGWRKLEFWRKSLKKEMLKLSRATVDKSKNRVERLKNAAKDYLSVARKLYSKLQEVKILSKFNIKQYDIFVKLEYFLEMLDKHIDLVERRLLKSEKIPHEEKIFSIFEPWVEWISKGKIHTPVELGKRTSIASDQWHFIIDWTVAEHQQDNQILIPCIDSIIPKYKVSTCSSDKGYFSKIDVQLLELFDIKAIIPKKGKCSISDLERESEPSFIKLRRKHSAIESNINELEHRGLDRCPDKGIEGLRRYVGLAVIAYNIRRIGKLLLETDRKTLSENRQAA
jgi:transposase, IS5 family